MSTPLVGIIVLLVVATFFYFIGRAMERVRMLGYVRDLRQGYKVGLMAGLFPKDRLTHEKVLNDFEQLLQPYAGREGNREAQET